MSINRRFLVRFGLIIVVLYLLSCIFYGLDYYYVHATIKWHYGSPTQVEVGGGGANGGTPETIDSLQFGNYNGEGMTPITPFLLLVTEYQYDLTYNHNGQPWEATGSVNFLGIISESSNAAYLGNQGVCLSSNTVIDTGKGQKQVTTLKVGDKVWSVSSNGKKVLVPIIKTIRRPVPIGIILLHVLLADNRQLTVSPNHPTASGLLFKDLKVGGTLDNSKIVKITDVSYDEGFTYDILPQSSTGTYWADDVLVGSTLKN